MPCFLQFLQALFYHFFSQRQIHLLASQTCKKTCPMSKIYHKYEYLFFFYYFCKRFFKCKHNLILYDIWNSLSDYRLISTPHLWYEDNERGSAEDGWLAVAPHPRGYDYQPIHRNAYRYVCNMLCAVVIGNHGDDCVVC